MLPVWHGVKVLVLSLAGQVCVVNGYKVIM